MQPPSGSRRDSDSGFEGAISGLGLPDVIQLNGLNRFSGCITVEYQLSTGRLFFRDGEIIHSEHGDRVGEAAFFEIMQWPGGRFSLDPNVTTTSHTIDRSWRFLLMEAARLQDEQRSGRPAQPSPPPSAPGAPRRGKAATIIARIRQVPGVAYAVVLTKDGVRIEDDSYEAEALEGQTAYLTLLGKRMGEILRGGEMVAAVVRGAKHSLVLLASRQHYLSILVHPGSDPGSVEAEVRRLIASGL